MKEIVGLDLSISSTGYCKCDADSPTFRITGLGSIKTKLKNEHTFQGQKIVDKVYSLQERISIIYDHLMWEGILWPRTIGELPVPMETVLVGVENYAFQAVGQGATMLAELQGVIRYHLYQFGIPKIVLAPPTVKAHVRKGGEDKAMIPMLARMKYSDAILNWGQELKDDDQADALIICELTWLYYRWSNGLPVNADVESKKVLERLKKIKASAKDE